MTTVTPAPLTAGVLLQQNGHGTVNTATFAAPAYYAVDYAYDCGTAQLASLVISAQNTETGRSEWLVMGGALPSGSGTTYGHNAGPTYLDVTLNPCSWTLTVRMP